MTQWSAVRPRQRASLPYGLVVRISGFHPDGRGSIPRGEIIIVLTATFKNLILKEIKSTMENKHIK